MCKINYFLFTEKCTSQCDIDQLLKLIEEVVNQYYDKLCALVDVSLNSSLNIANKMFAKGLICNAVLDKPTGNKIIDEFRHRFIWINNKSEAESHCKSLLNVFADNGGNFKYAAEKLKSEWLEKVKIGLGVDLTLD